MPGNFITEGWTTISFSGLRIWINTFPICFPVAMNLKACSISWYLKTVLLSGFTAPYLIPSIMIFISSCFTLGGSLNSWSSITPWKLASFWKSNVLRWWLLAMSNFPISMNLPPFAKHLTDAISFSSAKEFSTRSTPRPSVPFKISRSKESS